VNESRACVVLPTYNERENVAEALWMVWKIRFDRAANPG